MFTWLGYRGGLFPLRVNFSSDGKLQRYTDRDRPESFGCAEKGNCLTFLGARTGQTGLESSPTNTISHGEGETDANDDHNCHNEGPDIRQ